MSPVGHSLIGLAIGTVATDGWRRRQQPGRRAIVLIGFVMLANVPDAPLPGWGHDAYHVSHSLPLTLCLIATVGCLAVRVAPRPLLLAGALAWLSHLLLDSFYNHGLGVEIGWPLISYRLNLPIPWLQTLDLANLPSWRNVSVVVFELLTFGPFAAAAAIASQKTASAREGSNVPL